MGYFNIFYKITRIIDMLTRKRNRKAIMVILIIIAIVFLYHNKVNAQEDDLTYNQPYTNLRIRVDLSGILQAGTIYANGSASYYHSVVIPIKEGFTYKGSCESSPGDGTLKVCYVSELEEILTQYQSTPSAVGFNDGYISNNYLSIIGYYQSTTGFEYTATSDGFLIVGGFKDTNDYTYNNYGFKVYTNYNGESNLNTINQDLLRIENLLQTYLYGEPQEATTSVSSVNLTVSDASGSGTFRSANNDDRVFYIPIQKDRINRIKLYIKPQIATSYIMIGYSDAIPSNGLNYSYIQGYNGNSEYTFEYDFTGHKYIAIRCYGSSSIVLVDSYYITNIGLEGMNNTAIQQGEQTRETITSTEYNQSDVNINTNTFDNIDTSNTDGLFTTIFTNFNNAARGGVDSITIPMPHSSGNLVLYSNVVSSHLGALASLVSAFWYFVFGFYAFKFVNNLLHSIKNGNILDGFKSSSEVITQDML